MILALLLSVIQLTGVSGSDLRARAFFDANNVKVGDPLVLTVDFLGDAEFTDLHPPALSKAVRRRDWKLDDLSAKTSTFRDARRLTYRIRPMREGILWFPALEFAFGDKIVRTNPIPVHAKPGPQVEVAELGEVEENGFPRPPELIRDFPGDVADEEFRWRKALAHPKAEAFVEFDFPAGRMNEATCAICEGNWSRALSLYRKLEWQIGQTPEIERGIIAALALRYDNPAAELPMWRCVLRPLLRFGWCGRTLIALGVLLLAAVVLRLLSFGIGKLAAFAFALVLVTGAAAGETVETVVTNADGSVLHRKVVSGGSGNFQFSFTSSTSSGGGASARPSSSRDNRDPFSMMDDVFESFGFGGRRKRMAPVRLDVKLEPDKREVLVGETFNLTLLIEHPRSVALSEGVRLVIEEQPLLKSVAQGYALAATAAENPTNVIERLVFPMMALSPIEDGLHYSVSGGYTSAYRGGFGFFSDSIPFSLRKQACRLRVSPPPAEGRPEDYAGIVSEGLAIMELPDLLRVETNDVVTITYRLRAQGFVPKGFLPQGAAYEWHRNEAEGMFEYKRYFVAAGAPATPQLSVSYYDPRTRRYRTARCGGTPVIYKVNKP